MKSVTVWSKPSCVQCNAVKRKFAGLGIEYDEQDLSLEENAETLEKFKALDFLQAPVVTVDGEPIFAGFDVLKITEHFG